MGDLRTAICGAALVRDTDRAVGAKCIVGLYVTRAILLKTIRKTRLLIPGSGILAEVDALFSRQAARRRCATGQAQYQQRQNDSYHGSFLMNVVRGEP